MNAQDTIQTISMLYHPVICSESLPAW